MNQQQPIRHAEAARRLFNELVARTAEERKRRLSALDDLALRQEVASLLAAYEESDNLVGGLDGLHALFAGRVTDTDPHGLVGQRIGRYEVTEHLGGGGMGVVYRADDLDLERSVALKFISPHFSASKEAKQRLKREAKASSALDHPNIATVYEIGEAPSGSLFIAMAYYRGETLKEKIASGPLPVPEAVDYACQIISGLKRAHDAGIIHRDIKPANVMITEDGVVKIVDFGLAKVAGTELTRTGSTLGTAAYMSPEQARGSAVDHRTDLWSFGVTLYEMLSGQRPFQGESQQALMYEIVNEDPQAVGELREDVPPEVEEVAMRCLEKAPSNRCVSAEEVLSRLRETDKSFEDAEGERRSTTSTHRFVPGVLSESPLTAARLAAAVFLAAAFFLWVLLPGQFGPRTGEGLPANFAPRLAVLAPSSQDTDFKERQLMEDLSVTLTGLLTEMKPYLQEGTEIVAATEMGAISTVEQARDHLGASRVITLHLVEEAAAPQLTLGLVDAERLQQVRSASLLLSPSEREIQTAGVAPKLADLLDVELPLSFLQRMSTTNDVDPAALAYFEKGRDALERHQSEELESAIRFFNLALQNDSTFPEAYAGLAQAYWRTYQQTGDADAAHSAQQFETRAQAFEDSPRPGVYVQRGLLSALRGDYRSALVDFTFAVNLDPTHAQAHLGLARTLTELGHLEKAESTFQEAIRLNPEDWRGYNALGRFYFTHLKGEAPYEQAAEQFSQVIALDSLNGAGYVNLGSALFGLQRLEEARQTYEHALRMPGLSSGDRYRTLSNLGTLHYYAGRFEQAAWQFESALKIDSTDQRVWGNLVSSYDRLGEVDHARWAAGRAAERVERALAVRPDDPELLCDLAEYVLILGDRDRVRRLIDRVVEQNPRQAGVIFQTGHLYEKLGERERAIDLLLKSIGAGLSLTKIDDDPELAELRRDPRFQQAVDEFIRPNHNSTPIEQ